MTTLIWDEIKRQWNRKKHGLDVADLDLGFFAGAELFESSDGRIRAWRAPWCDRHCHGVQAPGQGSAVHHLHAACQPEGTEAVTPEKFSSKRPLTDEEEAEIQRMIATDPDNPELTDERLRQMRPFREVFPDHYASIPADIRERAERRRGPPRTKQAISIRLDIDLVEKLRTTGPGWQSKVNDILREWADRAA